MPALSLVHNAVEVAYAAYGAMSVNL